MRGRLVRALRGSLRRPALGTRRLCPADPDEPVEVTLCLRRGVAASAWERVGWFASRYQLDTGEKNAAQRSVVLKGTAARMERAFAVELSRYEWAGGEYRGRDGLIHVPRALAGIVQGVFGWTIQRSAAGTAMAAVGWGC